jgi:hypothetical protein
MEAKVRTFLMKVTSHRGEPVTERADDLVDEGRALTKNGKDYKWKDRTTRLVYSYFDMTSTLWGKRAWNKTIRNTVRKGKTIRNVARRIYKGV